MWAILKRRKRTHVLGRTKDHDRAMLRQGIDGRKRYKPKSKDEGSVLLKEQRGGSGMEPEPKRKAGYGAGSELLQSQNKRKPLIVKALSRPVMRGDVQIRTYIISPDGEKFYRVKTSNVKKAILYLGHIGKNPPPTTTMPPPPGKGHTVRKQKPKEVYSVTRISRREAQAQIYIDRRKHDK